MRRSSPLDALFPKTHQAILAALIPQPSRRWYLADLAKHLGVRPSSLQRELARLVSAGILTRSRDGNRVYHQPDPQCPFMSELRGIIVKTAGLVGVLQDALAPLAKRIQTAFVYGSIARGDEESGSDVDLMVIGDVGLADLAPLLSRTRQRLGRAVNATVFSPTEFTRKLKAGYSFPRDVLNKPKLFVIGSEHELEATSPRGARGTHAGKQAGN